MRAPMHLAANGPSPGSCVAPGGLQGRSVAPTLARLAVFVAQGIVLVMRRRPRACRAEVVGHLCRARPGGEACGVGLQLSGVGIH